MATVKPIKPAMSVESIAFDGAVSKARAMAFVLEELRAYEGATIRNNLIHGLEGDHVPDGTRDWLHGVVGEALRAALDEIEAEYRKTTKDGA
ncbi:MAG: hypothetical protein DMD96_03880 [Candidatus Rokuibacteriota bacterium]|nr:MAG: hypothetical protein DMD96_03880 [Candidatus Rokubacteria bacterium]